jgi:hypothetical protein
VTGTRPPAGPALSLRLGSLRSDPPAAPAHWPRRPTGRWPGPVWSCSWQWQHPRPKLGSESDSDLPVTVTLRGRQRRCSARLLVRDEQQAPSRTDRAACTSGPSAGSRHERRISEYPHTWQKHGQPKCRDQENATCNLSLRCVRQRGRALALAEQTQLQPDKYPLARPLWLGAAPVAGPPLLGRLYIPICFTRSPTSCSAAAAHHSCLLGNAQWRA